jgi:hypothetical protein
MSLRGEVGKMGVRTRKSVYIKEYTIRTLPHTIFFEASSKELLTANICEVGVKIKKLKIKKSYKLNIQEEYR